jgi:hypothetical protein
MSRANATEVRRRLFIGEGTAGTKVMTLPRIEICVRGYDAGAPDGNDNLSTAKKSEDRGQMSEAPKS